MTVLRNRGVTKRGPAPVLPQGPAAAADAADGEEPAGAFSEV